MRKLFKSQELKFDMQELLIIIISFLGLVIGSWLSFLTPEEFNSGKKYFILLKKAILFVLVIIFLLPTFSLMYTISLFIIGALAARFFRKVYFYLGLALALSFFISIEFSLLTASLIFIFGLPHGTLNANKYLKDWRKIIKPLIFSLVLFLLPTIALFFNFYVTDVAALISGAMFMFFLLKDNI